MTVVAPGVTVVGGIVVVVAVLIVVVRVIVIGQQSHNNFWPDEHLAPVPVELVSRMVQ